MPLEPVLIAEPDPAHAAAIAEVVRIMRPKVDPCLKPDGLSALNQLKDWRDGQIRPLVVIVGEALSRTGGLAVLNYMTTDPFLSPVPVVTFSSAGLTSAPQTTAQTRQGWMLDILADTNDPYDVLVRDLASLWGLSD